MFSADAQDRSSTFDTSFIIFGAAFNFSFAFWSSFQSDVVLLLNKVGADLIAFTAL